MESVASDLKAAREKQNISLAQMAADTMISIHYLECIEAGRFGELPGGMYNRAFLRAYCERLNLNQQEILGRYEAEVSPPLDRLLKSKIHLGQKDTSLRLSPILIWSLMLIISATGLFFSRSWIAEVFSPYFARKAPLIPSEIPKPPPPVAAAVPSPAETGEPVSPEVTSGLATTDAGDAAISTPPADSLFSAPQSPKSPETTAPATLAPLRLQISISEKCWVSVDRDGSPAVRRLMEPGETQFVNANEQFLLVLGNAGGVLIKINGKAAKPLGKSGEVVKVLINEKNLQDLLEKTPG